MDATAGFRMMWFNKQHPNAIYFDQRSECNPDVIGDFCDLKQFANETFNLVVFDPPHNIRWKKPNQNIQFNNDFGWLNRETWQSDIRNGLKECYRVLKPKGILIFKWATDRVKYERILPILPFQPLFAQITRGDKRKGQSQTYWFCFMKIPKNVELLANKAETKT